MRKLTDLNGKLINLPLCDSSMGLTCLNEKKDTFSHTAPRSSIKLSAVRKAQKRKDAYLELCQTSTMGHR